MSEMFPLYNIVIKRLSQIKPIKVNVLFFVFQTDSTQAGSRRSVTPRSPHKSSVTLSSVASSSSTQPSNITVQNINLGSGNSSRPVTLLNRPQRASSGVPSSSRTTVGYSSQPASLGYMMDKPTQQQSVSDFATSLTNALLGSKSDMQAVDLTDPLCGGKEGVHHQVQFNDMSLRPCSPCSQDEQEHSSLPAYSRPHRKLLPKTPAPSVDFGEESSKDFRNKKVSMNLSSLDFSLPISEVYEPETGKYIDCRLIMIYF